MSLPAENLLILQKRDTGVPVLNDSASLRPSAFAEMSLHPGLKQENVPAQRFFDTFGG
ncbi:hypothetical protein J4729_10950 [Leisingera sp. HS039]|uniref:hypothetical protein n=1 Tax=unclassified Leisingera TaxID=2614906 RepID=UPI001431F77F|nr:MULTISPECIES: hypothetical protein [unclassified Leisingera]MBQ4825062.1 hypothetical protein [Leisingera sp. HS039]